jgi:hypothetical protein
MSRKLFFGLLAVLVIITVGAIVGLTTQNQEEDLRVLFIGNSLTYANDLPEMIEDIADSQNLPLSHQSHTPGGSRFLDHTQNNEVLDMLQSEPWDVVVLQEQSQFPAFSDQQVARDVFPFAKRLVALARDANPDVKIVFYMTMARKNGDPQNVKYVSALKTYEGMQRRINRSYVQMAKDNKATVAPVGDAWETFRIKHPSVDLYADNVHPNQAGSYLAACVFFSSLYGKPCLGTELPDSLDPTLAADIQNVADKTVLGSRQKWSWQRPAN